MLTEVGKAKLATKWPPVHPRLEFVDDDGAVLFEHDLRERLWPGDSVTITWEYPRGPNQLPTPASVSTTWQRLGQWLRQRSAGRA